VRNVHVEITMMTVVVLAQRSASDVDRVALPFPST